MTSNEENDGAREARSVSCADAPGREEWQELAKLEAVHASACVRQARQTNHRLLTNMRISRNSGSVECRIAMRPILAYIRGERSAFMHRAWGHRNARNAIIEAARSESEDTQPKATHAQEDVDALVKAGQEALALFRRPGEGGTEYFDRKAMRFYSETGVWPPGKSAPMHIEECDDALERFQAWQDQKVDTLDTALTPFQKG